MGSLNRKLAQHESRRLDRTMEGGHERSMMSEDMPQLFHPGMPERTKPWTGDYEIVWSIYIRCNNRQKLRRVRSDHWPAPRWTRLGHREREQQSGLYALKPHWHLTARLNAEHPRGVYVSWPNWPLELGACCWIWIALPHRD